MGIQAKAAPWNTNNHNVLIICGNYYEEFALKYGLCVCKNEIELIPCKYIAIYENDTIKYLFEIVRAPMDFCALYNTDELKSVFDADEEKAKEWTDNAEFVRLFIVQKIADIGPVINDFISPKTGKLTPLTCGSPRYSTYDKAKKAKQSSDLECMFDDDCPPPKEKKIVVVEPEPEPKKKIPAWAYAIMALVLISGGIIIWMANQEPEQVVVEKIVEKTELPKYVLPYIYFKSGSDKIDNLNIPNLKLALKDIAPALKNYKEFTLHITGHADTIGREDMNFKLSLRRANTVRNWFIAEGIDSNRIKTFAKGASDAIADNTIAEERSVNRRVRIELVEEK